MKKLIVSTIMMLAIVATSFAQEKVVKNDTKVKRTSNLGQKVHNVFHKHKHYNGYKVKHVKKVAPVHH
jgi:Ni/Co efflux regulator RcnB